MGTDALCLDMCVVSSKAGGGGWAGLASESHPPSLKICPEISFRGWDVPVLCVCAPCTGVHVSLHDATAAKRGGGYCRPAGLLWRPLVSERSNICGMFVKTGFPPPACVFRVAPLFQRSETLPPVRYCRLTPEEKAPLCIQAL